MEIGRRAFNYNRECDHLSQSTRQQQLEALFQETIEAHHQAYADVDGADPDWPIWYAGFLRDRLNALLDASLTQSELVYLLITLDREVHRVAPGAHWQSYYARALLERYGK